MIGMNSAERMLCRMGDTWPRDTSCNYPHQKAVIICPSTRKKLADSSNTHNRWLTPSPRAIWSWCTTWMTWSPRTRSLVSSTDAKRHAVCVNQLHAHYLYCIYTFVFPLYCVFIVPIVCALYIYCVLTISIVVSLCLLFSHCILTNLTHCWHQFTSYIYYAVSISSMYSVDDKSHAVCAKSLSAIFFRSIWLAKFTVWEMSLLSLFTYCLSLRNPALTYSIVFSLHQLVVDTSKLIMSGMHCYTSGL